MRYVDDTFILIENSFDINNILQFANSVDSHIQFKFELQNFNTLTFLDVLVITVGSTFINCVHRKPFSDLCPPHALSNYPDNKKNAFYSYVYRALNIWSDSSLLKKELNYLKSIAIKRGFNPSVLIKVLKNSPNLLAILLFLMILKLNLITQLLFPFIPLYVLNLPKLSNV